MNSDVATEMDSNPSSPNNLQTNLVEAQLKLKSKFQNLNSEITELKSLLTTLVQQNITKNWWN